MEKMHLLEGKQISMVLHLQTSESSLGGLILGEVGQVGGLTFFKDMVTAGVLDVGNVMQMEALWFSFEAVIQNELDNVKQHWNTHRHGTVPGVPDVLFYLPQRSNAFECKQVVENPNCKRYLLHTQPSDDEGDLYQEYFDYVVDHEALQIPSSVEEAFNLFQQLKSLCVM